MLDLLTWYAALRAPHANEGSVPSGPLDAGVSPPPEGPPR